MSYMKRCGIAQADCFDCRYPVLSATDKQTSKILLVVVIALHTGLALAIKILFFA